MSKVDRLMTRICQIAENSSASSKESLLSSVNRQHEPSRPRPRHRENCLKTALSQDNVLRLNITGVSPCSNCSSRLCQSVLTYSKLNLLVTTDLQTDRPAIPRLITGWPPTWKTGTQLNSTGHMTLTANVTKKGRKAKAYKIPYL